MMDRLKAMQLFRAVHETGSFALAAERENLSAPALSRQIANLEKYLGARLFNRTTRRLSLTETGYHYLARVEAILTSVEEAEAEAGQQHVNPHGLLRISAPLSYSLARLSPVIASFVQAYPDVRLHLDMSDGVVDIVHEGIDVAIRISASPSINLIGRKIGEVHMITCASPGYLATHGEPRHPSELCRHASLVYSYLSQTHSYQFRHTEEVCEVSLDGLVFANNGELLRELAIAGHGITIQPDFILEKSLEEGSLVRILQDWTVEQFGIYAVYSSRNHLPAKIRVFIDHLVDALHPDAGAEI